MPRKKKFPPKQTIDDDAGQEVQTFEVELFLNERYFPMVGWGKMMLPTDRWKWSSLDGREERKMDGSFLPPKGYIWHESSSWQLDLFRTPSAVQQRNQDLKADRGGEELGEDEIELPGTDEEGYEYAIDFPAMFHYPCGRMDVVRRRRYTRLAKFSPGTGSDEAASGVGTASATTTRTTSTPQSSSSSPASANSATSPLICCNFLQGKCDNGNATATKAECPYKHSKTDPAPCQFLTNCTHKHESRLWQPGALAASCWICGKEFSTLHRQHHCRRCGRVVDADCLVLDGPLKLKTCLSCVGSWLPTSCVVADEAGGENLLVREESVASVPNWVVVHRHNSASAAAFATSPAEPPARKDDGRHEGENDQADQGGAGPVSAKPFSPTSGKKRFELQVVSDVHLEFQDNYAIERCALGTPTAPYLAICGDLTVNTTSSPKRLEQLERYIAHLATQFERIFYILGNHCVWYDTIDSAEQKFRTLEKKFAGKFVFLNCDAYDVPDSDVRLLGCTLWSDFTDEGYKLLAGDPKNKSGEHMLNDFRYIKSFDVKSFRQLHQKHVAWLEAECQRATQEQKQVIIMTHHAPFVDNLVPNIALGAKLLKAGCLGTSLIGPGAGPGPVFNTVRFPGLRCWLYGHTHLSKCLCMNGVLVASNQMGYPDDKDSFGMRSLTTVYPGFNMFDPKFKIVL